LHCNSPKIIDKENFFKTVINIAESTNLQVYEDPISPKVVSQSASSKFEIFSDEPESQKFSFPKPTAKRIAMKVKILKDDKENAVLTLQPDDIWKVPAKVSKYPTFIY